MRVHAKLGFQVPSWQSRMRLSRFVYPGRHCAWQMYPSNLPSHPASEEGSMPEVGGGPQGTPQPATARLNSYDCAPIAHGKSACVDSVGLPSLPSQGSMFTSVFLVWSVYVPVGSFVITAK